MGVRWILEQASRLQKIQLDLFSLTFDWVATLGIGATVTVVQTISADSDFAVYQISGAAYSAAATNVPAPNIVVTIIDQGSGRALQNNPVPWINVVGTAQLPFVLPEAKIFNGNGSIAITLTNLSGVAFTPNLSITLTGVKIFYRSGVTRQSLMGGQF